MRAIREDSSDDIFKELKIRFLKDLYIRSQKQWEMFRTLVNALSYDQTKLDDEEAKQFKKRLKQRLRNIEDTIDVHLNNVGGLEKYFDRTYLYKVTLLELNEDKIKMRDPKSLRMVDISQSYNMFDSIDYARAQKMQMRLDREILELDFLKKE